MSLVYSLSAAGFAATAISYGPARMGFGLFVPEFRAAFPMSTPAVGFISSLGFLGFFVALLLAQALLSRRGPAAPVLTGLVAATAGMGVVALAPNLPALAAGVVLAAASAGFAWTPFNDAVHRTVRDVARPTALSRISTGTSLGIAAAGLAALGMSLMGFSWRLCWTFFAIAGALALICNRAALRQVGRAPSPARRHCWRAFLHRAALPLFAIGFVFGTISAIYLSFAADHLVTAGGVPGVPAAATPALVFIAYGMFGLAGLATGRAKKVIGLPWLLRLLMLAGAVSAAILAILPGSWAGMIASAGLQGVHVMMTSAVLAFWSERLFPAFPSLGFTATLLAVAAGSVTGPALAGIAADTFGAGAMFLGTAALPAAIAVALRDRHAQERPVRAEAAALA
ncbi:MAG: MFS transporter [Sneathiellaceae bacterium]